MSYIAPSIFVNHGGGPKPVSGDESNREIREHLLNINKYVDFNNLKAFIIVTAHREEKCVTISSGKTHELLFDYYNFPPETYKYKYNAPGSPEIAKELHEEFTKAGIKSVMDEHRGWDHGVFIPMMLINPAANIPIIQLSVLLNQKAVDHFEIGRVLYKFREKGIAVIGSGLSYHNMDEMRKAFREGNDGVIVNESFDRFLNDSMENIEELLKWEEQPGALEAHPKGRAEHFLPLLVCAGAGGAGGGRGRRIFSSVFHGKFKLSGFIWE